MIPQITRIFKCESKAASAKWNVETDRGNIIFRIRNHHHDIKNATGSTRVMFRDSNDNRYEIKDYTKLDPHSIRILSQFL